MKLFLHTLTGTLLIFYSTISHSTFLPQEVLQKAEIELKLENSARPALFDEAKFNSIIAKAQSLYEAEVQEFGGKLAIRGDWRSEKLNAAASQLFNTWSVQITGGLARHPDLTADGFTLILCHEIGHHVAGFAFAKAQNPFQGTWAANEGQADYFATHSCARRMWGSDLIENIQFKDLATPEMKAECQKTWNDEDSLNLCYRTLMASESLIKTMAAIKKVPMPSFATPDPKQVNETDSNHPEVQCRMDTALQGALCKALFDHSIIPGKKASGGVFSEAAERESALMTCTNLSGYTIGLRPQCWYKPRF